MTKQPPRLEHNLKLANQIVTKYLITSRYPKVSQQLPLFPVEPGRLVRYGYNPTILDDGHLITMVYRYHDGDTLATRLALAQIDTEGKVISNRALPSAGVSMEDARLFWWDNSMWMAWVESTWPENPPKAWVVYGRLQDGEIVERYRPKIENPKSIEKNWVPFGSDPTEVSFIYQSWPEQVILTYSGENLVRTERSAGFRWPWGEPRGGATLTPYGKYYLRFFHSGLDNEFGSYRRRYFVGAALMELDAPYKTVKVSSKPILCGSEIDDLKVSEWGKCKHRKPQVVFPGGVVGNTEQNAWLLSVGVNDCECLILRVTEKDLSL